MIGAHGPVVAAGDDDVADGRRLASCDTDGDRTEVAERSAVVLDGPVERVDVLVRLGDDRDRSPSAVWSIH